MKAYRLKKIRASDAGAWIRTKLWPELLPAIGVVSGFFIELHHIVNTQWQSFFFNNSDSLTLSLVQQSIALKEPFHWVFASQIFLFPEGLLYGFSALVTPNFRAALILNAFLNCLLLYALFRWIAGNFLNPKPLSRLYALCATLFMVFLCFLEPRTNISVATPFFTTTSYYGVILASLTSVALITHHLKLIKKGDKLFAKRYRWTWVLLLTIVTLATLSDPLYLFQFIAPLIVVSLLALLLNVFSLRTFITVTAPQFVGVLIGIVLHKLFFTAFFSPSGNIGNYLHFDAIGFAARALHTMAAQMWHGIWQQRLEFVLIIGGMVGASYLFLVLIHYSTKSGVRKQFKEILSPEIFLVTGLASLGPPLVLIGSILTGNPTSRYFIPIIIFPLLSVLFILQFIRFADRAYVLKVCRFGVALVVGVVFLAALFSHPANSVRQVSRYYTPDQQCLDRDLGGTQYTVGVAQYWRARGLQLNSKDGIKVVQVDGRLQRFVWLYNSADYEIYKPDFVVVDKVPPPYYDIDVSLVPFFAISGNTVTTILGPPAQVYHCPSFDIYTYPRNTQASDTLKDNLRDPGEFERTHQLN